MIQRGGISFKSEIWKEFSEHINKFYWKAMFWTGAYCIISAGRAPLEVLKQYIQNQNKPGS
ncbi:transposase [Nostoc sp.]